MTRIGPRPLFIRRNTPADDTQDPAALPPLPPKAAPPYDHKEALRLGATPMGILARTYRLCLRVTERGRAQQSINEKGIAAADVVREGEQLLPKKATGRVLRHNITGELGEKVTFLYAADMPFARRIVDAYLAGTLREIRHDPFFKTWVDGADGMSDAALFKELMQCYSLQLDHDVREAGLAPAESGLPHGHPPHREDDD